MFCVKSMDPSKHRITEQSSQHLNSQPTGASTCNPELSMQKLHTKGRSRPKPFHRGDDLCWPEKPPWVTERGPKHDNHDYTGGSITSFYSKSIPK